MKAMWADHVASELARRWYDKPDPALLRLCDERRETARRQHIRATSWLGILIYVSFGYVDFVLAPDVAPQMFTTRIVLGAIGLILLESMLRFGASSAMLEIAAAATVVEFYAACLGLACTSSEPDAVSYYMMFGIIYMLAATVFFNFPPMLSVAAGVALLVVSFGITLVMLSVWSSFYYAFGSLYGSCFAFSVHVNWRLNVERYNGFLNALQAEIRQDEVLEQGKELLRLSNTDALTGLENRRSIDARLIRLWADHGRSGTDFAVLLLDIDCFKQFNDGYGHQEGDRCLTLVAGAIAGAAATFDGSAGRYGGEEFIILAPAATPDQASALAECVRSAVEAIALPHRHRRDGLTVVTVSIGASITRPDGAATPEAIVREADRALYEAKASGRNCVRSSDPGAAGDGETGETIAALLTAAIGQDLVSLVYQPIRGLASGRVEGVETLMRLRMPDGTPVPPGDFIPVAERTGAIVDLGLWAIRTVCRDLLADGAVPFASVNVSSVQLKRPGFAASVAAILAETGVSGQRLALEFSDGPDLGAHATVLLGITNLKQLGVRIWLDDFGTGFAGLSWLHLIDFDVVKIDRPFLHHCGDPEGLARMRDIVGFLRDRGHTILVEGVETPDQLALMHDLGIDQVQGFHVGVPVPATAYRSQPAAAGPMVEDGTERRPVERAG